jgi:DnaJ-class molecular chaperone
MQDQGRPKPGTRQCPRCRGDGLVPADPPPGRPGEVAEADWMAKCPECGGTGRVRLDAAPRAQPDDNLEPIQPELPADPPAIDRGDDEADDHPF